MRGSRVLSVLSVVLMVGMAAPAAPAGATTRLALHGAITGRWHNDPNTTADAGQRYLLFRGYGTTSLGVTGARGETSSLGNIRTANCVLNLRVTTASPQGQISVRITSLDQFPGGASCKAYNFRWRATRTTGAYAGMAGSGTGSFGMRNPTQAGADGVFKVYFH
jgi:hypothetical protein